LISKPAPAAARSIIRAKPAVVNGEPRSLTKMGGEAGLSRCRRAQRAGAGAIGLVGAIARFDPQRMMAKRTR
jgi:hypothetical protein